MVKLLLRRFFVTGLMVFSVFAANAQIKSFSPEPAVFIKELESFVQGAGQKSLNEDFAIFRQNWDLGKFSPLQQKSIIQICNDMLAEGMPVQPHFSLMLNSLAAFLARKLPDKVLVQWQSVTRSLLGKDNKDYLEFLKMTSLLFAENILVLDDHKRWVADNTAYDIVYEKGQIAIKFASVTLTCKGPVDRLHVLQTSGYYLPGKRMWMGTQGKANFNRVLPGENATVEFGKFTLNLDESEYTIDSARLNHPKYFGAVKVLGKFTDKLSFSPDTADVRKSTYPRFASYANSLEIKGIVGPNATFKGGFSMNGKEINTQTANGQETEITIYYKLKKKAVLRSKTFKISDGAAVSPSAGFTLLLDSGGTISHPNANVNFNFKEGKLLVNRGETGLMRVPFTDDFHKVDLDVQQVRWKIDQPFVDFDNINKDQEAKVASSDFYREIIYARTQGALSSHPLQTLNAFYNRTPPDEYSDKLQLEIRDLMAKNRPEDKALIDAKLKALQARKKELRESFKAADRLKFSLRDYADFSKTQPEYLHSVFIDLHDAGFLTYYQEKDSALILPKLFKYVQAHEKTRDYDVIRLSSLISKRPNVTLNLLSNELNMEGVLKFYFSDSQNVVVVPTEQQVTILKNRRLRFGGMIRAGRFDFFGKKFEFDYNNFQIAYSNIDSMRLYFPDSTGRKIIPIKSVLRNIYGTLFIDKPNNKSGLINYPEYPIFKSSKGSEVLYDKPHIHGGAYKSDKFKFVVDPFTIDSLDNFTIEGLQFDGTFLSDGIFPDFRYHVSIQKDYSLGFVKPTPPGGYPMYRGKGKGEMVMSLSEEGLYGLAGQIDYSGSTSKFKQVLLLPDKAVGTVDSYEIPQGAKYPKVYAADAGMEWNPYKDEFHVAQGANPIKVFKMGYDFYGNLTQTPVNLKGNGTLSWNEAKFASQEMTFGPNKTSAEKASLKIYAADSTKIAFETDDVKGNLDFDKRQGVFTTNKKDAMTKFPFNMYVTNLNDYKWNMDPKTIEAKMGPAMVGTTPYWLSTNPTQDSLRFEGKKGIYDLNQYTLQVEQIPYIDIADSRVFLKNGKVTIRENANMDQVDSAKIIANRIDKFHEIYNLTAKIYGKNKLRGKGNYQYVNKLGNRQEFFLDSVIVNRDKKVEGWGRIDETQNFTLDTKIGYKGFAQILSTEKNIQFTGYVKPLHTFKNVLPSVWLRYNDRVDPKNVVINVRDPRDKDNKKQYVGLFVANDSSFVYPLFFSWKRRYSDPDVTNDTGVLYYDHAKQSFFAGNEDKLLKGGLKGSFMQLNESNHTVHAEGPLDFGLESPNIKFKNAGVADLFENDSTFTFNMAMMLDFPLHKDYVARLKEMMAASAGASVNINNDFFKRALGEMVTDDKSARAMIKNIEKTGNLTGKDEAEYKLVLSDATFRWDSRRRGMYCNDNVSVASVAGTPVNKNIKATMLLEHKRSGENMYIYLDLGGSEWLYVNLTKTTAYILSSDTKLNEILINTAEKLPVEDFYVRQATQKQVERFLAKFGE
ncbi:MAG: hypothetical protein JNL57_05005 [Bacteroidetes bacterium]|nr:hypothetical protein [Bacteroidota bacterium]